MIYDFLFIMIIICYTTATAIISLCHSAITIILVNCTLVFSSSINSSRNSSRNSSSSTIGVGVVVVIKNVYHYCLLFTTICIAHDIMMRVYM